MSRKPIPHIVYINISCTVHCPQKPPIQLTSKLQLTPNCQFCCGPSLSPTSDTNMKLIFGMFFKQAILCKLCLLVCFSSLQQKDFLGVYKYTMHVCICVSGQTLGRIGHTLQSTGSIDSFYTHIYFTDVSQTVQDAGTIMAWNLYVGKYTAYKVCDVST